MRGCGLLEDPARRATEASVYRVIESMGFVQVDTINIVERAHHHILMSRLDGYRPEHLRRLLEERRRLFEHWTHDASIIPSVWFPQWRRRFERFQARWHRNPWWKKHMRDPDAVVRHVLERIEREGPLASRHFEHPEGRSGPWWGWKPQKAALEFLWRSGRLSVARRENFHKVYDLTERVYPQAHAAPPPDPDGHVDWACASALERLGVATPSEIAAFWASVDLAAARRWCRDAAAGGRAVEVLVESADGGPPRKSLARPDWRQRLRRSTEPPRRLRLLSPFDPVLRDRARALRLFGFDYRFEAFVPAAKRRYGYYVLPLLEGDRLVGRLDPKFHRDRGVLEVRRVWWEPGVKPGVTRTRALRSAVGRFAEQIGAADFTIDSVAARARA